MRPIDADALSEKLCETTIFIKDGEVFQRMINDAPTVSAEAVQGWIPVSERLPEEDGEYLVASGEFIYVYSYGIPLMPMNERNRRWGWYESTSEGDFYMDVDAWMPLPKPYKGGDEE